MKGIPGPAALSKPWKAIRRWDPDRRGREIVFGATAAAAACGLSPYKTPLDLYCDALGLTDEQEDNDAMRMGRLLEPVVLSEYETRAKVQLRRGLPMFFHETISYMGATPDGVSIEEREEDEHGVDAKTSTYRRLDKEGGDPLKFGLEGTDQMPVDYVMQGQQQIAVLNVPYVAFPVLFDGRTLKIYRVDRNDDLINAIVKAEGELVERLKNNDPPEPNWTHDNTRELIGLLFGLKKGKSIDATDEQIAQWEAVKRRKARIKTLEERNEADLNKVLFAMQGAAAAALPGKRQIKRIVIKETVIAEYTRAGYEFLREAKGE
jgi:predicted phage-related endonuclease